MVIPIKDECAKILKYNEIEKYRKFTSNEEKQKYIGLLEIELKIISVKKEKLQKMLENYII